MDMIALWKNPRALSEICPQGGGGGADVIRRVAVKVVAIRNSANKPIALDRAPSAGHVAGCV